MSITLQTINIGTVAEDGTGDTARDAFDKVNDNFTELSTAVGGAQYLFPGTNVIQLATAEDTGGSIILRNNAAGSSYRITFEHDGTAVLRYSPIDTTWDFRASLVKTTDTVSAGDFDFNGSYTVAGLPSVTRKTIAQVTDANSPSIGSTVTGGGSSQALVWYNGSAWTVIGV